MKEVVVYVLCSASNLVRPAVCRREGRVYEANGTSPSPLCREVFNSKYGDGQMISGPMVQFGKQKPIKVITSE
jgi:hypothetical protein